MQSHSTGPIQGSRIGALSTNQSFSFDYVNNGVTGVPVRLFNIPATPQQPVQMLARAIVVVADNSGTTATLSVGTASSGTQLLSAVDLKAAAGTNYNVAAGNVVYTASTDIWALKTMVGTAATAGQVVMSFSLSEVNITQPNNAQG